MSIVSNANILTLMGGSLTDADQNLVTLIHAGVERLVKRYVGYNIEQATYVDYWPIADELDTADAFIDGFERIGDRTLAYSRGRAGRRVLPLRQRPVRSVESVYENPGAWDAASAPDFSSGFLLATTEYQLDTDEEDGLSWSGFLYRLSGGWSPTPRTVRIAYTAGLSADELTNTYPEFKLAVFDAVMKKFNEYKANQGYATSGGGSGAIIAETLADYSVEYDAGVQSQLTGLLTDLPRSTKMILEEYVALSKFLV